MGLARLLRVGAGRRRDHADRREAEERPPIDHGMRTQPSMSRRAVR